MSTLVTFHAHPDDEAIATGGTMARAAADGHRVVLVVATDGAFGEVPDDLSDGETLADRRRAETLRSAEVLGVARTVFLDYRDSGMTGWEGNDDPASFWQADVDDAAQRLADVLIEENADVVTIYDWHGGYGHPDHIQVHRVGGRAAELAVDQVPGLRVLESTMNRDEMRRGFERLRQAGITPGGPGDDFDPDGPMDDGNPMGTLEAEITLGVDVVEFADAKRGALAAHGSQVSDQSFFLQMDDETFRIAFGREWFIERDHRPNGGPPPIGWIFDR